MKAWGTRAFTLIELLIVVAIIGILAAIAIPNFMNAQVRAKVSRVQADHATIATALESYCIDFNTYPKCDLEFVWPDHRIYPFCLTVPIAYLPKKKLDDPFRDPAHEKISHRCRYRYLSGHPIGTLATGPSYTKQRNEYPCVTWLLFSCGPDEVQAAGALDDTYETVFPDYHAGIPYDPTNGIMSNGDIYRFREPTKFVNLAG